MTTDHLDTADADRLELLDRLAHRSPSLALAERDIKWATLEDGAEALLVDGGGLDGGNGTYFTCAGDDVHAVGSLSPVVEGYIGCIVIKPDGSRYVARAVPDPLAE